MTKKEKPATTQAEYDKAYEEVKSGKQPVPSFDDMGPLPKPEPKKEPMKPVKKMAKGGSASSRADGCATKGKTKGTMIVMKGGGYAC